MKGRPFRVGFERWLRADGKEQNSHMDSRKYIGLDVPHASISVAVRHGAGNLVMECIIETKAGTWATDASVTLCC
jgi:hypothetical protein